MNVQVLGKNVAITPALRAYAGQKVSRLERPLGGLGVPLQAQVTMRIDGDQHIVEVTVPLPGLVLRAEEATDDMYAAIDLVVDKLLRQVERYKARWGRSRAVAAPLAAARADGLPLRPGGRARVAAAEDARLAEGHLDDDTERVVRIKRFAVKPQSVAEAILQMELLGHDFYVFREANTGQVQVLYRRRRGQYGLIAPE